MDKKMYLLNSSLANELYEEVKDLPIIDYHSHNSAKEIYENKNYENISEVWLKSDHYKWKLMRQCGISNEIVMNPLSTKTKFTSFCEILPKCIGNPVMHWSHLEVSKYFDYNDCLSKKTADSAYEFINKKLALKENKPQGLLSKANVKILCTTDDPVDDLHYHNLINKECSIKVYPTFRPDRFVEIQNDGFCNAIKELEECTGKKIFSIENLVSCLEERLNYFIKCGCKISDHGFSQFEFVEFDISIAEKYFDNKLNSKENDKSDLVHYKSYILYKIASLYSKNNIAMQLHIGASRDNNSRFLNSFGKDCGGDAIVDQNYMDSLSLFLNMLELKQCLPKTIAYNLDPSKNTALVNLLSCFSDGSVNGKMQFGAAWWFNDCIKGMNEQLYTLSSMGVLGNFVGMVTDSRSLLSYVRIDYFRRVLCNFLANMVEEGFYPYKKEDLIKIAKDVSYYNVLNYFNFSEEK